MIHWLLYIIILNITYSKIIKNTYSVMIKGIPQSPVNFNFLFSDPIDYYFLGICNAIQVAIKMLWVYVGSPLTPWWVTWAQSRWVWPISSSKTFYGLLFLSGWQEEKSQWSLINMVSSLALSLNSYVTLAVT